MFSSLQITQKIKENTRIDEYARTQNQENVA